VGWFWGAFKLLPVVVLLGCAIKNRAGLKRHWKAISRVGLAVVCVSSLIFTVADYFKSDDAPSQKIEPTNEPKPYSWRKNELPGKWSVLYDQVWNMRFWETKLVAIETFCKNEAVDEPKLPVAGFDKLVNLLWDRNTDLDTQWKRLYRVRDACLPHMTALPVWVDEFYAELRMKALADGTTEE
jgi:hypothetical protein